MTTAKDIILTAIKFKGLDKVKAIATELAEDSLCSRAYVLNVVRNVKNGKISIS